MVYYSPNWKKDSHCPATSAGADIKDTLNFMNKGYDFAHKRILSQVWFDDTLGCLTGAWKSGLSVSESMTKDTKCLTVSVRLLWAWRDEAIELTLPRVPRTVAHQKGPYSRIRELCRKKWLLRCCTSICLPEEFDTWIESCEYQQKIIYAVLYFTNRRPLSITPL